MIILQGFVQNVILKNENVEGKNTFAIVGINDISVDNDGFETMFLRKIMVAGADFKKGLHNVYRPLIGSQVYAPVRVEIDTFMKDKPRERYSLVGPPLRLAEQVPVQSTPAKAVGA